MKAEFNNPFRPGAGHKPPYLAGREVEKKEFRHLLKQSIITDNLILTGLRGVGKTVLLDELKSIALSENWQWVGTDLSESTSISETNLAHRLITDMSVMTSSIKVNEFKNQPIGFLSRESTEGIYLDYNVLMQIYDSANGLVIDKLKEVFLSVSPFFKATGKKGMIFAYDEAQNLADHAQKDQFPLSLLLDLFQSLQRQNFTFMLVLSGLPTLFPKLVEARTYAERMFRVLFLKKLSKNESHQAIKKPIENANCPVSFSDIGIEIIYSNSKGYPYFIQFICREAFDSCIQQMDAGMPPVFPLDGIIRKLDSDFFAGRWARVTDRQQELLFVIASLDQPEDEFTVQEIVSKSAEISEKPFNRSHINQMLASLITSGLIYKDRHGKYMFAVPLMADFIRRVMT